MKYVRLLVIISLLFLSVSCKNNKSDAIKFKEEYESINGKKLYGHKVKSLNISKNNPIKYSTYDEILDVIENKTGIIYLGYKECPWCRSAVPVLLEAASDYKIDTIYYMDIKDERDTYEVKDNKLVLTKKGTKGYYKLLKALDSELDEYVVTDADGNEYKTGEKRIYVPFIIFVLDGKIVGTHTSTVTSQESGYDDLNEEQYDELNGIYANYIKELVNNYCDEAC